MTELNLLELECLEKIASGSSNISCPCTNHVLHHLLSLGLIEYGPRIQLPLEMMHVEYRLTLDGRTMLQRYRSTD
jgi:hypothetical protein